MQVLKNQVISTSLLVFFLSQLFHHVSPAKILMTPVQFESFIIMHVSIGEELVRRGHDVHMVMASRYPKPESILKTGIRIVTYHLPDEVGYPASTWMQRKIADFVFDPPQDVLADYVNNWLPLYNSQCDYMFDNSEFIETIKLMNFDLVVSTTNPMSPCSLLLPHVLDIKFVTLSVALAPSPLFYRLPALPSFYGTALQLAPTDRGALMMPDFSSFKYRLLNALSMASVYLYVMPKFWNDNLLSERYKAVSGNVVTWNELIQKSELILRDVDHHFYPGVPLLPNVVAVAGVTARPSVPLAEPFDEIFAQSGEHGVILASFGSTAYYMPLNVIIKFLDGFSRLEQTVIAKFSVPDGVAVPDNVKLVSWLPQNDILGHNKTRLFITHCGNNGQYEALYHGVPMLGFPMFAEQSTNCLQIRHRNYGLEMDLLNFTSSQLQDNIRKIIENATYKNTIEKMSRVFKDQPMMGREKAAFWIEHVIKYGGAHLRTPATTMPIYQLLMVDVMAFIAVFLFIVIALTVCLVRLLCRRCVKQLKFKAD